MPLVLPQPVAAALARGATVLTSGEIAARALRESWDQARHAEHLVQWQPASVLTLNSLLEGLWTSLVLEGREDRLLLNAGQEHTLWRTLLLEDRELPALGSVDRLAAIAADAARQLALYEAAAPLPLQVSAADHRAFARWAQGFDRRCRRDRLLAPARLAGALTVSLERRGTDALPTELLLVEMPPPPPAVAKLLERMERLGVTIRSYSATASAPVRLHKAPAAPAELAAAAEWARQQLASAPEGRYALLLPDLAERGRQLERALAAVLPVDTPHLASSTAIPLANTAAGAAALALLHWSLGPLPVAELSRLMLSPLLAADAREALALADFDAFVLRQTRQLRPQLSIGQVLRLLAPSPMSSATQSLQRRLRELSSSAPGSEATTRSFAEWAESFRKRLGRMQLGHSLSHAGGHGVSAASVAAQAYARWESVLDELATLAIFEERVTAAEALERLQFLARQRVFAPPSQPGALQILDPADAVGVPFDGVWLLGADDRRWPPASTPNPLLPLALARALGLPGADAARDAAAALDLHQRITAASSDVIFSYALQDDDGAARPSPLLAPGTLIPYEPEASAPTRRLPFEALTDDARLPSLPDPHLRGGANVLKLQSDCPFRAFAERRVWAAPLDEPSAGLNALERGSDVHDIMAAFWNGLSSQAELKALPIEVQHRRLDEAIATVLAPRVSGAADPWDAAYLQVQAERLQALLQPWLRVEETRPGFSLRGHEMKRSDVAVGPLRIDLRLDRVDETPDGDLVIDYKTGDKKPALWKGKRPEEPQLPLYAAFAEPGRVVAGTAFAILRAGEGLKMSGFATGPDVLEKPTRNVLAFSQQLDEWHHLLTGIAQEFYDGHAAVDPRRYPATCKHCGQRILCRVNPQALPDTQYEGEDAGEADDDV